MVSTVSKVSKRNAKYLKYPKQPIIKSCLCPWFFTLHSHTRLLRSRAGRLLKSLFGIQHLIQTKILHKQTRQKGNSRQRNKENPNSPQTIRIKPLGSYLHTRR